MPRVPGQIPYRAYHRIYSDLHQDPSGPNTGVPVMPHICPTNKGTAGPVWAGATLFQSPTAPYGQTGHYGHACTGPAKIPYMRYATYGI